MNAVNGRYFFPTLLRIAFVAMFLCVTESGAQKWMLGPFVKYQGNPVLSAATTSFLCPVRNAQVEFERRDAFNPAAIVRNGKVYIFYRCEDTIGPTITSRIGMASSDDGFVFTHSDAPAIYPQNDAFKTYEWPGGCEDPRIIEDSSGTYYLYYTGYNGTTTKLCVATSTDLTAWQKRGPIFSIALGGKYLNMRTKSCSPVTRLAGSRVIAAKINGKYWMYWGESPIFLASSDNLIDWTPIEHPGGTLDTMVAPRSGKWDNLYTEPGPPALLTDSGIVFLYNAANGVTTFPGLEYTTRIPFAPGQMLFSKTDPGVAISRTDTWFMKPDQSYELNGIIQNVCFIEGLVYFNSQWLLYYGAADTRIAVTVCDVSGLPLLSPAINDSIRSKNVYFHWQSGAGAVRYEIWVDGTKRGETAAQAKFPVQEFYNAAGLGTGQHTWYVVAIDAGNQRKQSTGRSFTILPHPDLPYWAIGPFQKFGQNPVLSPRGAITGWEYRNVLNPGVHVDDTGCFQMVYRAQGQSSWVSKLGCAHGMDGLTFERDTAPVIVPTLPNESQGCEDPRLVRSGNTYYCYYCGYNGSSVVICVATSTDLRTWTKHGSILANTKNPCVVINSDGTPALFNGKYWMFHGDQGFSNNMMLIASSTDLINWTTMDTVHLRDISSLQWEPCVVLADASPNEDDLVMFIAGKLWGDNWFNPSNTLWYYYAISEVVIPKSNMREYIDRLDGMIMLPTKPYEANGQFNNCIFTNSVIKNRNTWWNHYGAGDSRVAAALAPVRDKNFLGPNLAKGKTATASSSLLPAGDAFDSSCATRWTSQYADNEWIMVDLGAVYPVSRVILKWETAYGKNYAIQVSNNGTTWTDVYFMAGGNGDIDEIVLPTAQNARYVRMDGTQRGTTWGFSLWEFEVYGAPVLGAVSCRNAGASSAAKLFVLGNAVGFFLPAAETVTLTVLSPQGRALAGITRKSSAGRNTVRDWEAFNRLPAGVYCLSLKSKSAGTMTTLLAKAW